MSDPYYADENVTIYHGNCRDIMAGMADQSVDCVITDPPYSERTHESARSNVRTKTGGKYAQRSLSGGQHSFDSITLEDLTDRLADCGRISRGWVVATLDTAHAFALDANPPPGLRMLRVGAWVKTNPMPQISGDRPGTGWEAIAFLHRSDVRPSWNGGGRSGVWILPSIDRSEGHPAAKPLKMVSDWVRLFTNPGDLILDPWMGSGTTLRACIDNGRKGIGVEIKEQFCGLSAKRVAQGVLDFEGVS